MRDRAISGRRNGMQERERTMIQPMSTWSCKGILQRVSGSATTVVKAARRGELGAYSQLRTSEMNMYE